MVTALKSIHQFVAHVCSLTMTREITAHSIVINFEMLNMSITRSIIRRITVDRKPRLQSIIP
jgi:hypothetical protein